MASRRLPCLATCPARRGPGPSPTRMSRASFCSMMFSRTPECPSSAAGGKSKQKINKHFHYAFIRVELAASVRVASWTSEIRKTNLDIWAGGTCLFSKKACCNRRSQPKALKRHSNFRPLGSVNGCLWRLDVAGANTTTVTSINLGSVSAAALAVITAVQTGQRCRRNSRNSHSLVGWRHLSKVFQVHPAKSTPRPRIRQIARVVVRSAHTRIPFAREEQDFLVVGRRGGVYCALGKWVLARLRVRWMGAGSGTFFLFFRVCQCPLVRSPHRLRDKPPESANGSRVAWLDSHKSLLL